MKNLNKTLKQIFEHKYLVPLYQRNYAWEADEISQLLQDLYENFKKAKSSQRSGQFTLNYFIGSLVVLKRRDNYFEVIDGQQRLTTLSILLKILKIAEQPTLFYESRPEVEAFFDAFYHSGETKDITTNHNISHLINAVDLIKESIINPDEREEKTLSDIEDKHGFRNFIANNVILVKVEIPQDTDVAAYFEIMNNRGEQLQKHEILKSHMLETIKLDDKYLEDQQNEFSKIWNACSQMDINIQKLFKVETRKDFFGDEYDTYERPPFKSDKSSDDDKFFSIDQALTEHTVDTTKDGLFDDVDDSGDDQSIIDFPNFLMHVFKLKYGTYKDKDGREWEIPLNEKDLILVYEGLKDRIIAMDFIDELLYYRTVFDRYILKSSFDDLEEDNYRWSLNRPHKYEYLKDDKSRTSLKYRNSFDEQERLIKSQSLLQVTFRNRKYKNWLQHLMGIFKDRNLFHINISLYQKAIDQLILNYFVENIKDSDHNKGVKVPHFLFNFIDYLYWQNGEMNSGHPKFNFNFKYRNSVEHHLPQSFIEKNNEYHGNLDNLGNLCLVSKSSNSRMNNESPVGKAEINSKFYRNNLPPKQKVMYDLTNTDKAWGVDQIQRHAKEVADLLSNGLNILFSPV
jgi:uncharacterized protein with ParB-like and HNH nuclease domain